MLSVLHEIAELRAGTPIEIDYKNTNRYRVVAGEENGTKTAYYFTAPIYNAYSRKAVDFTFKRNGNVVYAVGSNATITVHDGIRMENAEGSCVLRQNREISRFSEREILFGEDSVSLTTNGVAYQAKCESGSAAEFEFEVSKPYLGVRANDRCFSLMSEKHRPFATVSGIGSVNAAGEVIAPALLTFQKLNDKKYRLTLRALSPDAEGVLFEANLYEPKLVQDTTVESRNPGVNNAFGGAAFIGSTPQYGEQWLYSRPDMSSFADIADHPIQKAILHLPRYNNAPAELRSYGVAARFCSFGSNWNNKVASSGILSDTTAKRHYHSLDITSLLTNAAGYLKRSEGFILKPRGKEDAPVAIATGDSYYAPQIFEINYR